MTQGSLTLVDRLLDRLVAAPGHLDRASLREGLQCSDAAFDDAVADLVINRKATYTAGAGYRLAAGAFRRHVRRSGPVRRAAGGRFR